jgi:hypothetical protein
LRAFLKLQKGGVDASLFSLWTVFSSGGGAEGISLTVPDFCFALPGLYTVRDLSGSRAGQVVYDFAFIRIKV